MNGERSEPKTPAPLDVAALIAEEEAALREALAFWDESGYTYGSEASFYTTSHNRAESHYVATVTPDRLRRLLATLDAARDRRWPSEGDIDAAYCRAKHAGEHLGRAEGCGSWTAKAIYADLTTAPRFDHDGMAGHHHDSETSEPVWWREQSGEQRHHLHRHLPALQADTGTPGVGWQRAKDAAARFTADGTFDLPRGDGNTDFGAVERCKCGELEANRAHHETHRSYYHPFRTALSKEERP